MKLVSWIRRLFHITPQQEEDNCLTDQPRKFKFKEIQDATRYFSLPRTTACPGNTTYFEGHIYNGTKVIIKAVKPDRFHHKQFMGHIKAVANVQSHQNLVSLIGFCVCKRSYFLVYNNCMSVYGSLDKFLFNVPHGKSLPWSTRVRIIHDIAQGLGHLHKKKVVHLDLKPQSVFLDENFGARITDFGFRNGAIGVCGTPGYMAPEWLQMRVSEKMDIYSFGIILLEIVSGVKAIHSGKKVTKHLGAWAFQVAHRGKLLDMVDPSVANEACLSAKQAEDLVKVGVWCIQADARMRPTMASIIKMLERKVKVLDPPLPPLPPEGVSIDMDFSLSVVMEMMDHYQGCEKKKSIFFWR